MHISVCSCSGLRRVLSLLWCKKLLLRWIDYIINFPIFINPLGLTDLTRDNKTEHLRTINILKRFNVYQEVVLAAIYKIFHLEVTPSYLLCSSVYLSFMSRYWKSPSPIASQERLEIHNGPEKCITTMMHIQ